MSDNDLGEAYLERATLNRFLTPEDVEMLREMVWRNRDTYIGDDPAYRDANPFEESA